MSIEQHPTTMLMTGDARKSSYNINSPLSSYHHHRSLGNMASVGHLGGSSPLEQTDIMSESRGRGVDSELQEVLRPAHGPHGDGVPQHWFSEQMSYSPSSVGQQGMYNVQGSRVRNLLTHEACLSD